MAKTKQEKATLRDGTRVNYCIIIRREQIPVTGILRSAPISYDQGNFYFVTVAQNGNYLDSVLTTSSSVTDCKRKIKASINFWNPCFGSKYSVYHDYEGARTHLEVITV